MPMAPTTKNLMFGWGIVCLGLLLFALSATATAGDRPPVDTVPETSALERLRTPDWGIAPPLWAADPTAPNGPLIASAPLAAVDFDDFDDTDRDVVSVRRAVAYSLLLPGAGQWYTGERRRGGLFLAADAIAWGTWGYLRTVGGIKKDDHRDYAAAHADIDPEGKDDSFYRMITFYESRDRYNENRDGLSQPVPNTAEWNWQWDSPASQQRYRDMRNQSNEAYNRAKFALGAVVLTRIVAAIDAWRVARAVNRAARMEMARWKIRLKGKPSLEHPSVMVILSRRF